VPGVVSSTIIFSPAKTELTDKLITFPVTVIAKFASPEAELTKEFIKFVDKNTFPSPSTLSFPTED
jgi:hypothetical protein